MNKLAWAMGIAAMAAGPAWAIEASTIDWTRVPGKTLTLFYPGQASYEWIQGSAHKGARETVKGQSCAKCHEGAEKKLGAAIVKGGALEPTPVAGKNGSVDLAVQVAYDEKNAYFRFQWKTQNPFPGTEHQYLRYDGKEWKVYGYPKLDQVVREGKQPGIYEDRLTLMIDDGKVPGFARQGCWLTCHDGERDMPNQFTKEQVGANALLAAIKKSDVRKYLPATRADAKDWKSGKSPDEIARLKAEGGYVDLVQWRAHRSHAVGMADDGYVLEFRNSDAGKDMFAGNADPATHAPKYMWDASKVGYKSITEADLRKGDHFLVREANAVPFDPNAGWKAGDMIPDYVVSRADARGSARDNDATATWKDGTWMVTITRPLGLGNDDDKALREGAAYNMGFAVHDDNITTRGHFVSFPVKVGFGTDADIKATRLQ